MCVCAYVPCSRWPLVYFRDIWFDVRWAGGASWEGMRKESDAQEEYKEKPEGRWDRMGIEGNKRCDTAKVWMGHSVVVLTVIVHSSLKFMTEAKAKEWLMRDGLLFPHRPLWSWLCCPYCSSILWGLGELYTPPPPYTAASDTTTSGLQWRLKEKSTAHIQF